MTPQERRELDAWIARTAFGWKHLEFTRDNGEKFVMFMSPANFTRRTSEARRAYPCIGDEH
jgi:hypothetical protein